jgi:hypothetical protein
MSRTEWPWRVSSSWIGECRGRGSASVEVVDEHKTALWRYEVKMKMKKRPEDEMQSIGKAGRTSCQNLPRSIAGPIVPRFEHNRDIRAKKTASGEHSAYAPHSASCVCPDS